jgi:predicted dehydrogenase
MIDLLRFFGGEIIDINGYVDNLVYKSEVDDFAVALAKFENGGYGYLNVSYNNKKAFNRIEILGHKGSISIDKFIGVKHQAAKLTILLNGQGKMSFRKRGNKVNYMLRSVQKSFLNNEPLMVTGEDGLKNMKLMEELERKCCT